MLTIHFIGGGAINLNGGRWRCAVLKEGRRKFRHVVSLVY